MELGAVDLITNLIGSVGFPIAVAAYLLVTVNKTIGANIEATNSLSAIIQRLVDRLDVKSDE